MTPLGTDGSATSTTIRRTGLLWTLGTMTVLFVVVGYTLWSASAARSELLAAQASTARLEKAVAAQNAQGSKLALHDLQDELGDAHRHSSGPVWALGTFLPVVGDDVDAVRTVADVGDELVNGAVAKLVSQSGGGLARQLVPQGGRINLSEVNRLAPLVAQADREFADAAGRLDGTRSAGLTRWVRPSYERVDTRVQELSGALAAANHAVRVLPTVLGRDGPRTYVVMLDNNAEIRATGGLPGAYAIVRANRGRLTLSRQGVGSQVRPFGVPVLPQSEAERALYAEQIGQYFLDTNFTPEFPRTAALVREIWKRRGLEHLDGVFSIDAVSVSYLLRATGPVTAPGRIRLTSQNATRELINNVYFRLPNDNAQNDFFAAVAKQVFDKLSTGVASPAELIRALAQSAHEGRVYAHDFDSSVQSEIAGTAVAGEIARREDRVPQVGFYLNDATGSKMSYYLRTKVRMSAESCAAGAQQLSAAADLTYTGQSPPVKELPLSVTGPGTFGTPKGEQLVLVRIYGPTDGELGSLRVAGRRVPVEAVDDRGRPVTTAVVQLRRGETVRVSWRVRTGRRQDRPTELRVTPGLDPVSAVTSVPNTCR